MSDDDRSWLDHIVDCVHEDARDPQNEKHYRDMTHQWAEQMLDTGRPLTVSRREQLRRCNPEMTDEEIEKLLRLFEAESSDGTGQSAEETSFILHSPIAVTAHSGTPLNKKYATLAAIHDDSEHCDFPIIPEEYRPLGSLSPDEKHNFLVGMKFAVLKQGVRSLTVEHEQGLRQFLDVVAADLRRHYGDGRAAPGAARDPEIVGDAATEERAPEWSVPLAKVEMARRLLQNERARPRQAQELLERYGIRREGNKWAVRLDLMDQSSRERLSRPFP